MSSTVLQNEIDHFAQISSHWWDEDGPFKPLHKMNPARALYIKEQICNHYRLEKDGLSPLEGLSVLDIGCGGGLISESMARLGAEVTGIDAGAEAIDVAKEHAKASGLSITYENKHSEELNKKHDVVLAIEIIEHVRDLGAFVRECARLVKPGGLIIFSSLNRTPKSFALGIVAAEYILRWVPKGTHNWKQFVKPSELARHVRHCGLETQNVSGMIYNPISDRFSISDSDLGMNYFLVARLGK